MGRIAVHEFMALDGMIDAPTWSFEYPFDPRMGEAIGGLMGDCEGILLGRRTYVEFAGAWAGRSAADDPGAPFINGTPKFVVSGSLPSADWGPSTILGAYSAPAIRSLKERTNGSLYVSGSATLVRAMLADGLVDELHLFVYPLALGAETRLFDGVPAKLELAACESYASGVVHLDYRPGS